MLGNKGILVSLPSKTMFGVLPQFQRPAYTVSTFH
jgi:hypothetical protein